MWRWIQNALSKKRQQFFFDILILVTCIHIIIIVCAGIYQSKRAVEQISLIAPDASKSTLVFVPLYKKIEQPKTNLSANSVQKPHHMMNYDEFLERQKKAQAAPEKKLASPKLAEKKSTPKKAEVKKTLVSKPAEKKEELKKGASEKTVVQKIVEKKSVAATSLKNESVKSKKAPVKKDAPLQKPVEKKAQEKAPAQKALVEKKQEVVKETAAEKQIEKALPEKSQESEKVIVPEQKIAEVIPQEPEEVAQELAAKTPLAEQKGGISSQENVLPPIDMNEVTFVGVQDLEHLQVHQIVSGQLAKYWKRPVGMENKICVIKIELDITGKIVNVLVEKSSGVPMYDIAAKAAALKPIYPQEIWNKKLVIQF